MRRIASDCRPLAAFVAALLCGTAAAGAAGAPSAASPPSPPPPINVLVVTIDTLRADRLSGYGYARPTSPNLDRLMAAGARFATARTVEPLTGPALSTMLTGLYPHEHGATRNGIRVRRGLFSLPRLLAARGWKTAAFVGTWPLRDELSGLAEHFEGYNAVLTRKRWFGWIRREADATDVNEAALAWLDANGGRRRPFFLWVHYAEPHAPYLLHADAARRLGIAGGERAGKADRYDTEIAFVDGAVGELLSWIDARPEVAASTLVVFTADHGESLGEHGEWGHGRTLHEPELRIPLSLTWPGKLAPRVVAEPATILDVPKTVLALLGQSVPAGMRGFDWSGVLAGEATAPADRVTLHQAHRGAVTGAHESTRARRAGLLAVARIRGTEKEILQIQAGRVRRFDLAADPQELHGRAAGSRPSADLGKWLAAVEDGLVHSLGREAELDPESIEALRSLGYLD